MGKSEKKARSETPAARMRERFVAGDFRAARAVAASIAGDPSASAEDKELAVRLVDRTSVDKRALQIGGLCVALAAIAVSVITGAIVLH